MSLIWPTGSSGNKAICLGAHKPPSTNARLGKFKKTIQQSRKGSTPAAAKVSLAFASGNFGASGLDAPSRMAQARHPFAGTRLRNHPGRSPCLPPGPVHPVAIESDKADTLHSCFSNLKRFSVGTTFIPQSSRIARRFPPDTAGREGMAFNHRSFKAS